MPNSHKFIHRHFKCKAMKITEKHRRKSTWPWVSSIDHGLWVLTYKANHKRKKYGGLYKIKDFYSQRPYSQSQNEAGDKWSPAFAFTTGLQFTLPGVRKKWAPGWTFITSPLFTFPEARDKRALELHIYDQTPVYISRSAPRYENQQQK